MHKRLIWIVLLVAAVVVVMVLSLPRGPRGDGFERLMTLGQGYLEKSEATNAVMAYAAAVKLAPESIDARLNLANAYLLANNNEGVLEQCRKVIELDHNEPAAYYLMGCAHLRLNQPEEAVQAFQQSQRIDPAVNALNFQLGLAQDRAGHMEDAIQQFETLVQFAPEHPSAHYQLSRLYQRAGRGAEAATALAKHQELQAKNPGTSLSATALERCKYTQPRVAFTLEQPDSAGIPVRFADATADVFGQQAANYRGPLAVLDYDHDGRNSLLVREQNGFRLLDNLGGKLTPRGALVPGTNATYRRALAGDLNNDRFEDVVVLGEEVSHVLRFATNGQFREVTAAAGLKNLKAKDGVLADLDFTGKLDLLTVQPGGTGLRLFRNLGSFYFLDSTTNSGLPEALSGTESVAVDDWRNEDVPGVFVTRKGEAPAFFIKQRAGGFVETNSGVKLPPGSVMALGDLNNDLLLDLALSGEKEITVAFGGGGQQLSLPLATLDARDVILVDYDNDGWLDIVSYGSGVRVWRNAGKLGFQDVTAAAGLDKAGPTDFVAAADFDLDGDTDLVAGGNSGLRYWRNDGGNANHQLKLRLVGNRSNASGLGCRVEVVAGRWRTIRTLQQLPFEIGLGKHEKAEKLQARWSDLSTTMLDVPVQPRPLELVELVLPTGSCPYLYAWDGQGFRFVTDILGAAPLGLPVSLSRYAEQDPEEFLALGNDEMFPAREGSYEIRITEELREVLYLDEARLVVVDHPPGTLVTPTSKMRASGPFPAHDLWTLRPLCALKAAWRSDGQDVTDALRAKDNRMAGPVRLREPQLRGLAEPFEITLDFGQLPTSEPLVLVLTGWLRFGGGMANVAGSLDPALPFPFPVLQAEVGEGTWRDLAVDFGVPAGKTKTIVVDLENHLPPGTQRLRIRSAFELYWDEISICARAPAAQNRRTDLTATRAELHWRGFSEFASLPAYLPLTPEYGRVVETPPWRRTPYGWCTRYGDVSELVANKDNALALLNGGDELSLSFAADRLPAKPEGFERDFFLHAVGWDKDADFHVGQGWRVEPLPFHGMSDQEYGRQAPPPAMDAAWARKYNTRWVGQMVLRGRTD